MDLLLIPICLLIGGGLIYLGVQGMPRLSFSQLTQMPERMPFDLMDWLKVRSNQPDRPRNRAAHDAELNDLMNEMIAVREELSTLKLNLAVDAEPVRRTTRTPAPRKTRVAAAEPARRQYSGSRRYIRA